MPSKGDDAFSSVSKKEENVCMTILYPKNKETLTRSVKQSSKS